VWAITVNSAGCLKPVSRHAIHRVVLVRKREDFAVPITPTATQPLRTLTAMASASQRISLRAATTGRVLLLAAVLLAAIGVPARLVCVRARTVWATTANSAGCLNRRSRHAIHRVVRAHKREDLAVPITPTATQPLRTPTVMELPSQRTSLRAATTVRVLLAVLGSTVGHSAIVTQPLVYAFATPVSPPT